MITREKQREARLEVRLKEICGGEKRETSEGWTGNLEYELSTTGNTGTFARAIEVVELAQDEQTDADDGEQDDKDDDDDVERDATSAAIGHRTRLLNGERDSAPAYSPKPPVACSGQFPPSEQSRAARNGVRDSADEGINADDASSEVGTAVARIKHYPLRSFQDLDATASSR